MKMQKLDGEGQASSLAPLATSLKPGAERIYIDPVSPIFLIFMQFSGTFCRLIGGHPSSPLELVLPLGNPGSATCSKKRLAQGTLKPSVKSLTQGTVNLHLEPIVRQQRATEAL